MFLNIILKHFNCKNTAIWWERNISCPTDTKEGEGRCAGKCCTLAAPNTTASRICLYTATRATLSATLRKIYA
ncbi:hypothetical protein J6590_038545 [Homalodisca vitripennis]|nr:hypothetical protein J6590_038545 [Homalodisca vitripennis]